ncbi:MAG: DUF2905 domain-containing protein [Candidatus Omnitrophota bacterium]|nr:MAG: DUF2905 domain-containing protein [Candidatus Omnitrophota bacterium]
MGNYLAKVLISVGVFLIFIGIGVYIFSKVKIPFLGRLPGDILIKKDNFVFFFPLATCLLLSLLLTLLFFLFRR